MILLVFAVVLRVVDLRFAISQFFESPASLVHRQDRGCEMDYEVDLCHTHSVIRLTVMAETVTREMAEEIYRHLSEATSSGGPYAAIFDLSAAKHTSMPTESVRSWGRHRKPVSCFLPCLPPGVRLNRLEPIPFLKVVSHHLRLVDLDDECVDSFLSGFGMILGPLYEVRLFHL